MNYHVAYHICKNLRSYDSILTILIITVIIDPWLDLNYILTTLCTPSVSYIYTIPKGPWMEIKKN